MHYPFSGGNQLLFSNHKSVFNDQWSSRENDMIIEGCQWFQNVDKWCHYIPCPLRCNSFGPKFEEMVYAFAGPTKGCVCGTNVQNMNNCGKKKKSLLDLPVRWLLSVPLASTFLSLPQSLLPVAVFTVLLLLQPLTGKRWSVRWKPNKGNTEYSNAS